MAFSQSISLTHTHTHYSSRVLMKHRKLWLERDFTTISDASSHGADLIRSLHCFSRVLLWKLNPIDGKIVHFLNTDLVMCLKSYNFRYGGVNMCLKLFLLWILFRNSCTCAVVAHQYWKSQIYTLAHTLAHTRTHVRTQKKTCKICVQLCFSPNDTLYLHHILIHYNLLLTVT